MQINKRTNQNQKPKTKTKNQNNNNNNNKQTSKQSKTKNPNQNKSITTNEQEKQLNVKIIQSNAIKQRHHNKCTKNIVRCEQFQKSKRKKQKQKTKQNKTKFLRGVGGEKNNLNLQSINQPFFLNPKQHKPKIELQHIYTHFYWDNSKPKCTTVKQKKKVIFEAVLFIFDPIFFFIYFVVSLFIY